MSERCKETVYPNERYGAFHGHQCTRKAVKDGYCKIHHPDSVRKRQEISAKRYNERIEQSEYAQLKRAREEIERLTQQLEEAKRDAERLNALINNSHWTIMGSDEKGYLVWDQSDGLTAAGGGKTAREAIDKAMEKSK